MSPAKLKILNNYLNKDLAKDWIQEFKSLTEASILFALKKNSELHFCINYCDLNTLIIKN